MQLCQICFAFLLIGSLFFFFVKKKKKKKDHIFVPVEKTILSLHVGDGGSN